MKAASGYEILKMVNVLRSVHKHAVIIKNIPYSLNVDVLK